MIFSWGRGGREGGERREPGRDCTLYSRTCEWAYNTCELRQVEWDITCLSYKNCFFLINFTYLTTCRRCVPCYLSLFCYFSNLHGSVLAGAFLFESVSLPAIDCLLHYAVLTKCESSCRILAKVFWAFYEHTMPMSGILTKQGWSMKECIKIGRKRTFSRGTLFLTRKIASGYDRPILPARVANQNKGIVSYCPLADSAI